jgi:hypothetical protein
MLARDEVHHRRGSDAAHMTGLRQELTTVPEAESAIEVAAVPDRCSSQTWTDKELLCPSHSRNKRQVSFLLESVVYASSYHSTDVFVSGFNGKLV